MEALLVRVIVGIEHGIIVNYEKAVDWLMSCDLANLNILVVMPAIYLGS
jgi:hypothetical protein